VTRKGLILKGSKSNFLWKINYVYACMGIAAFTLDAGLLARSQYPEGPTTTSTQVFLGFSGSKSKC
jgi:hypothetical protein